jgi:hypothetical protein
MAYRKISVDTVYQKVLALASKEQRGYITPQEFNLFAKQAQQEIFDNYFHDLKTAQLKPKNSTDTSDEINLLNERISIHRKVAPVQDSTTTSEYAVPDDAYIISKITFTNTSSQEILITELDSSEFNYATLNPLTAPQSSRPIYIRAAGGEIEVKPNGFTEEVDIHYIARPDDPNWGYVVVNGKALYNVNTSVDFDLHDSEENNLVMRILTLAGVSMKDQLLTGTASQDAANTEAKKNN